ncbi:hypothetical protein BT93_L0189 [Corymbia citriodora subsp. variegata]|uniref:Uncharacterized protein n=1 Tax=Corymbia citriodora subsp. variegata TaxID=360336 RepID=A0A8T0CQK1_CORYI|nr:hypothetical protein BT93_L0189 [Corymbia citriodora subsp. variegata]
MEEHKHRACIHFLKLSGKFPETFLESWRKVEHELKDTYDALDLKWKEATGDQFPELMITDGCFMLEILRATIEDVNDYVPNDPIFSIDRRKFIEPYISQDMLLLENQLPMQVLYKLVADVNNGKEDYVNHLIGEFYFPGENKTFTGLGKCLHVLDVFRRGLLMEPEEVQPDLETEPIIIRSATELQEAGIRFKPSKTNSLKDIHFDRGLLELPLITVDDTTKSTFLNAMTFERLHSKVGNEVTSYVIFMDKINNIEQDVALLHAKGIIQNYIGSDKAVANLFNSLCKEVTLPSNISLDVVPKKIDEYCNKSWNKWMYNLNHWRANLNRTYFSSPWAALSLIGATFLFALTVLQTVYIVLAYY